MYCVCVSAAIGWDGSMYLMAFCSYVSKYCVLFGRQNMRFSRKFNESIDNKTALALDFREVLFSLPMCHRGLFVSLKLIITEIVCACV